MRARVVVLSAVLVVMTASIAQARAGDGDTRFGSRGIALVDFDNGGALSGAAVTRDRRILLAGWKFGGSGSDFAVARFSRDGLLDRSFGRGGIATANMMSYDFAVGLAEAPGGKIVLGGMASNDKASDLAVARFTSSGALDRTFSGDGRTTIDLGGGSMEASSAMAVQPDGKIIVVGVTSLSGAIVVRLATDGSLDPTFGAGGKVYLPLINGYYTSMALAADGSIYLAGLKPKDRSGLTDIAVAKLTPVGTLDPRWGGDGDVTLDVAGRNDVATDVAIGTGGAVVVGGVTDRGGAPALVLARWTSSGSLDRTFSSDGVIVRPLAKGFTTTALATTSSGSVVVYGTAYPCAPKGNAGGWYFGCWGESKVLRFKSAGTPDPSFGRSGVADLYFDMWSGGIGGHEYAGDVVMQGSNIIVAGTFGGLAASRLLG